MEEQKAFSGCMIISSIIILICIGIFGGSFRTDVINYVPNNMGQLKSDTTINMDFTSQHYLVGIIKGKQPNIEKYISNIEKSGYQLCKLEIKSKHSLVNMIITGITLTIYTPMKIQVQASFTKIK